MTLLTPFAFFLGTACMAAVLKSRPQEAAVLTHAYKAQPTESWHPSVPESERYESVTVIPDPQRAVVLRVIRLPRFFGPAVVLHEWRELPV